MAAKISEKSDRKKYKFAQGLSNDLKHTRAALRTVASENRCTFGYLYEYTEGRIANLNRVLQNMKRANEIEFADEIEMFLSGVHDNEEIALLPKFWNEEYQVDETNVFRPGRMNINVPEEDRRGRSYVAEDIATRHLSECCACSSSVKTEDRMTIRGQVFHLKCIKCAVCGSSLSQKKDYITFDAQICCSAECIHRYDAANVQQQRL